MHTDGLLDGLFLSVCIGVHRWLKILKSSFTRVFFVISRAGGFFVPKEREIDYVPDAVAIGEQHD
jgi:hypothetical protein